MATMEKQKSKHKKKVKSKSLTAHQVVEEADISFPTTSIEEPCFNKNDLSEDLSNELSNASQDLEDTIESVATPENSESTPLLGNEEKLPDSVTPVLKSNPGQEKCGDQSKVEEEQLVEIDSPVKSKEESLILPKEEVTVDDVLPKHPYQEIQKAMKNIQIPPSFKNVTAVRETAFNRSSLLESSSTALLEESLPVWLVKPFSEVQLSSLYHNIELEKFGEFVTNFVESHLRPTSKQTHPLHELLVTYLRAINRVVVISMDVDASRKEAKEKQSQLWILETTTVTNSGECQDGNPVSASHKYQTSSLNKPMLTQLGRLLVSLRELVNVSLSLEIYLCEAAKLQIEFLIQSVILSSPELASIRNNDKIILKQEPHSQSLMQSMLELKTCIGILFSFQRRPMRDERFVRDTQDWLSRLVSVLLRVGNWEDYMFILNHILRCPAGVGQWGYKFVQTPPPPYLNPVFCDEDFGSPFSNPYLNHMVATLATIILPIRERAAFLEQFRASLGELSGSTDAWIVIDSDGEDDEDGEAGSILLKENDLVAFLNQVSVGEMFRIVLCVVQQDGQDVLKNDFLDTQYFLRLLSFGTALVRLLRRGLEALAAPRYRQLSKRLGRLVRHTVQYITDVLQIRSEADMSVQDPAMLLRAQVEYDAFLVRATNCIYSSRHLGAWQFLAVLPYNYVSLNALWQLWYALHDEDLNEDAILFNASKIDWENYIRTPALRSQLEDRLVSMPDSESFYLLTTFTNMALCRSNEDWAFIRAVALDLLQIGFMSPISQETCSKHIRIFLSGMVARHPPILSEILFRLSENFSAAGKLCLYLFRELPLDHWQPMPKDVQILSQWLLRFSPISLENGLARYILSNLNWGLQREGPNSGELSLAPQFHRDVAILILKAAIQYSPDTSTNSAILTESVKQVSSMVRALTPEEAFLKWVWELFARLRLHLLDQSEKTVSFTMKNPGEVLLHVPELEHDCMREILLAVKQGHALASFAALSMTQIGHNVPLICDQGFDHMHIILSYARYETALKLLQHIIPLFLECAESLLLTEKFCSVIQILLQADNTYLKMAKNLIVTDFPGNVLKQFGNMIQSHLKYYKRYNQENPSNFVYLWMQVLTRCPDWAHDNGVIYLLDIILRAAFFDSTSKMTAIHILRSLLQNNVGLRQSGTFSTIISWVSLGSTTGSALLPNLSCLIGPWYAYFALEIEEEEFQEKNGLWKELLRELSNMSGKTSIDSAVKKAASNIKRQCPPATMLSIYRWSQQALDTPVDHPLQPLYWQKFFLQYLARAPTNGNQSQACVGSKFFDGMINLMYLKKIKKKLQECKEFYWSAMDDCKPEQVARRSWLETTAKIVMTMGAWLEEPRLHEASLYLPALPPLYNADKLSQIIQGDKTPWFEFLDYEAVNEAQDNCIKQWETSQYRYMGPPSPNNSKRILMSTASNRKDDNKFPAERIIRRLQSYDCPDPPPEVKSFTAVFPPVKRETLQSQNATFDALRDSLRIILEYAQLYALRMSEHTALDCSFLELVPALYRDVPTEVTLQATCQSEGHSNHHHNAVTCAGPANIRIMIKEARVSERTEHLIAQNRNDYHGVITRAMQPPPLKVCASSVQIEQTINQIANEFKILCQKVEYIPASLRVKAVGVELFYHLVAQYNEDLSLYPPTKQLLTTCVETLGQAFICGDEVECERLLECMVENPRLAGLLGPHFTPSIATSSVFLVMYNRVAKLASQPNTDLSFVLLSKFDVSYWLSEKKPRLNERTDLIELIGKALTASGPEPPEDKLILHEMFRNHLCLVLRHDFPEHYCEILNLLLKTSENQSLSPDVWYTVINLLLALGIPQVGPHTAPAFRVRPEMNPGRIIEELRQFAANQKLLQYRELIDTATMLASHFNRERLQYGLYGLYPKYRTYVEPLAVFLGLIGHCLIVSTLQNSIGIVSNKICEQLWPTLSALFFPWIAPYWTDRLSEPAASWIQRLTDDRSVLPPWIVGDAPRAQRLMGTFVEVMRFVLDTLPANNLLGFLWQFYVSHFAHTAIKDHILTVVHTNFLTLPWMRLWPAPTHLDNMLKVVDQYLPECHAFLGCVFVEVAWMKWISQLSTSQPVSVVIRVHTCLLHLLVKLANEPSVRQSGKILTLLVESRSLAWHLLDAQAYEPVINWYVMSVDPRAVLRLEDQEGSAIDSAVIRLVELAAGFTRKKVQFHSTTQCKRKMFIRAMVKVLVTCASRQKTLLDSNKTEFQDSIQRLLDDIEGVVSSTVQPSIQIEEGGLLLTEFMGVVNQSTGSALGAVALSSSVEWLRGQNSSTVVVPALLKIVGKTVNDSVALGTILESTLESYFSSKTPVSWADVVAILQPSGPRQPPTEETFAASGHLLSLYGFLLLQLADCRDIREEAILLNSLSSWLNSVRPSEPLEAKLPLLWCQVLRLSQRQVTLSGDRGAAAANLRQLVHHVSAVADHKGGGWGLLGAIGIGKQLSVSPRCRLLCRFLCSYVSAQLPESKDELNIVRFSPNAPGSITQGPNTKTDPSLDIHPSADALKHLTALEGLLSNKMYAGIRLCVETAVTYVRNPENSIHNAEDFLRILAEQLYTESYIHDSAKSKAEHQNESHLYPSIQPYQTNTPV